MLFIGLLIVSFLIVLFLVSKIAEMLNAKKSDMGRILLASVLGGFAAAVTLILLVMLVEDRHPAIMWGASVAATLIVSSLAYKYINGLSWGGAITTNIANVVLSLVALTASVVLSDGSINDTVAKMNDFAKKSTMVVQNAAKGDLDAALSPAPEISAEADNGNKNKEGMLEQDEMDVADDDLEPTFKETDLLPPATVKELKAKEKKVYIEPKFRVISLSNVRSAVGKNVRVLSVKGKTITGLLRKINGNNAVIEQHLSGGSAITPVSFARIRKFEVYK